MDWPHTYSTKFADHAHRYPFLHRRFKRGDGLGWGASYKPWISIRSVKNSISHTPHVLGCKSGRIHHLLSLHECSFFYLAERWPWVIDIREQWPILDFDRTNVLHYERGIGVPKKKGEPRPATIDFLLTERHADGRIACRAVAVKPAKLAIRPKTKLYLDVQRAWCEENGIPFTVVQNTGDQVLNDTLAEIRSWFDHRYEPSEDKVSAFVECFLAAHTDNATLGELLQPVCKSLRVDEAEAQSLFRYSAWSNRLKLDLHRPVALNACVVLETEP